MLIVCPSCATSYDVDPANLGKDGRAVRCLRCRTVWYARPNRAERLVAAAAAIAPERAAEDAIGFVPAEPEAAVSMEASTTAAAGKGWFEPPGVERTDSDLATAEPSASDAAASDAPQNGSSENSSPEEVPDGSAEIDAPSIAPVDLGQEHAAIAVDADQSAETAARDRHTTARRRQRDTKWRAVRWPLSRLQSGILALIIIDAIVIGWRTEIVRILPQTASFYASMGLPVNVRGLRFEGVSTSTEQHEGVPILVVEGNVINQTGKLADVPRLKLVLRNGIRHEIYSWTAVAERTMLPPGEAASFRARLASPPPEGRDLMVRFLNRRDVVGGAQ